ncbi:translation initiation factor IF-2-like [Myotis myotis]|uniref:translation initiation factor IF-2-like n=1 Tax=Myotis myotis TaxID=51298 RepID=UPI00174D1448|nr:translation initiation factor IF-2-like [Myotis myotis]
MSAPLAGTVICDMFMRRSLSGLFMDRESPFGTVVRALPAHPTPAASAVTHGLRSPALSCALRAAGTCSPGARRSLLARAPQTPGVAAATRLGPDLQGAPLLSAAPGGRQPTLRGLGLGQRAVRLVAQTRVRRQVCAPRLSAHSSCGGSRGGTGGGGGGSRRRRQPEPDHRSPGGGIPLAAPRRGARSLGRGWVPARPNPCPARRAETNLRFPTVRRTRA